MLILHQVRGLVASELAYLTSVYNPKKRKLYASSGPIAYAVSGPQGKTSVISR